jgi:hypothetical protein
VKKALPLLVLVALVAATFLPLAASGRALVYRDLVVYTAPQDAVLQEAVLERHELPRRNPYIYGGIAHLADPSTQTLYPPRLLCALLFAMPRSIDVFVILHVLGAAVFASLFARSLGASRAAAAAGGAVYSLSGPVLSLMENLPLLAGATWLPLACALARRRSSLAAVPVGLIALAGDIQGATWASLLVLGILLARRRPARAVATPVLGLLLAGVLLVPAFRLRDETTRPNMTRDDAGAWSLAPARLVELAVPFPFGVSFPDRTSVTDGLQPPAIHEPWSETLHVGVLGLALGAGALLDRRRRRAARVLLVLAGLALLAAMGPRGGVWDLLRLLPFYGEYRHPEKHLVLFALVAAPLAALGVDAARRRAALLGIPVVLLAAAAAWLLLGVAARASVHQGGPGALFLSVQLGLTLSFLVASALLASKRRRKLIALLVALDVLCATHARVFVGDATLYDEHPLGVELVRASGSRVLRFPFVGGGALGPVPKEKEMPGRRFEERAIAARVRSWVGSVAARERVPAAHGMTSFEPKALDLTELDGAKLDGLEVRYLVTRADGVPGVTSLGGVAALESYGVLLSDRGERVGRAPPVSFGGEVPGMVPGVFASVLGLALLALARRFL